MQQLITPQRQRMSFLSAQRRERDLGQSLEHTKSLSLAPLSHVILMRYMAKLTKQKMYQVNVLLEKVGQDTSLELRRNGVTAN